MSIFPLGLLLNLEAEGKMRGVGGNDKAAAGYEAGMPTVRVPKAESAKPRQIAVKPA